jgi:DNA primase
MERVDIADVVGAYVSLRRCGSLLRGLSPFNEERTPSFFVNPDRRIFKCYSSGHGGDAIAFLRIKEQMSFPEAVEFLAGRYGLPLEFEDGHGEEGSTARGTLLAIHERVGKFFRDSFFAATTQGHCARLYWTAARKFSLDCAERCGIGLALTDWRGSLEELRRCYGDEALVESGLFLRPRGDGDRILPRFRGRLMFPIHDGLGRIVAFSGRLLDGLGRQPAEAAKYVNSPETDIFHKGSTFFGLCRAKEAAKDGNPFVLTEGPLDCIRCWECGLNTAIAAQGTAVTAQHMAILRRHAVELHCLMDGDGAGHAAALRLIPHALKAAMAVHFLQIPGAKDPDEYFLENGAEAMASLLDSALSPIDLLIESHLPNCADMSSGHRQRGLREILAVIGAAESRTAEIELVGELSKKTAIQMEALREDYLRWSPMEKLIDAEKAPRQAPPTKAGEYLLWLFLRSGEVRPKLCELILPEWIDGTDCGERLLNHFIGEYLNGVDVSEAMGGLIEEDSNYVCGLLFTGGEECEDAGEDCLSRCVALLHGRYVRKQLAALVGDGSGEASAKRAELQGELRRAMMAPMAQAQ